MICEAKRGLPGLYEKLMERRCLWEAEICGTEDGFCAAVVALAEVLARRDITCVPGRTGNELECNAFFDDWYLYAVPAGAGHVYSLFKLREQEQDAKLGGNADGDTPGVTVCFVALEEAVLLACLDEPTAQNRARLNEEINRVVAYGGQRHSRVLKEYFIRTQAQGAYLIAQLYTWFIASLVRDGSLPVPERYREERQKRTRGRISCFIEENNRAADKMVCDHERIYIQDPLRLTEQEQLAILATHTGNTSVYSFAAEVQFHARYLTWWTRIPIPFVGKSPYASAIRADMSIGDAEFVGPTPYHRPNSAIVKKQRRCHQGIWTWKNMLDHTANFC